QGGIIGRVEVGAGLDALHKVGVCKDGPPKGDEFAQSGGEVGLGAGAVVAARKDDDAPEGRAYLVLDNLRNGGRAHAFVVHDVDEGNFALAQFFGQVRVGFVDALVHWQIIEDSVRREANPHALGADGR